MCEDHLRVSSGVDCECNTELSGTCWMRRLYYYLFFQHLRLIPSSQSNQCRHVSTMTSRQIFQPFFYYGRGFAAWRGCVVFIKTFHASPSSRVFCVADLGLLRLLLLSFLVNHKSALELHAVTTTATGSMKHHDFTQSYTPENQPVGCNYSKAALPNALNRFTEVDLNRIMWKMRKNVHH